jgi:hypothetical protein
MNVNDIQFQSGVSGVQPSASGVAKSKQKKSVSESHSTPRKRNRVSSPTHEVDKVTEEVMEEDSDDDEKTLHERRHSLKGLQVRPPTQNDC